MVIVALCATSDLTQHQAWLYRIYENVADCTGLARSSRVYCRSSCSNCEYKSMFDPVGTGKASPQTPSWQVEGAAQDVGHLHMAPGWTLVLQVSSGSMPESGLGVISLQFEMQYSVSSPTFTMASVPSGESNVSRPQSSSLVVCIYMLDSKEPNPHGLPVATSVTFVLPAEYDTPGGGGVPKAFGLTKKDVPLRSIRPARRVRSNKGP